MRTCFLNWRKLLVCCSLTLGAVPAQALAAQVVGEVTTVIGKAAVIRAESPAVRNSVTRGLSIQVGDRLETSAGGHVHIRFVDGGLVSVLPLSRLHVQDYAHANKGSSPSAIHFNLEQGVVRSITGSWGEENRERFRLNTPVVAIGIKGTDFVVHTEPQKTEAHVVTGAIVMTPLSDCQAGGAHCNLDSSVLLSSAMGHKTLAFDSSRGATTPQMVAAATPAESLEQNIALLTNTQMQEATKTSTTGTESPIKDALGSNTAPLDQIQQAVVDKPMLWVRNALGWGIPANSISVSRPAAQQMEGMQAVVGNFVTTLYRDQQTHPHYLGSQGQASFALREGSASYNRPGLFGQPVAIHNPRLDVDFQAQTFATQLDLSGNFGSSQFSAEGRISPTGMLVPTAVPAQNLAGSLSHDARQAGYQFDKRVADRQVSGLTLWGR